MDRYPTTTLAEKTGLRASIAREQVRVFFLRFIFSLLFWCLFCGRLVDIDFGAEFAFDRRKKLLELALGFGNLVALVLNRVVKVVDEVVLFGDLTVEAIDDVVLFVHLAVEAVDDAVLFGDLAVEGINDAILFGDLAVERIDDAILFGDLAVKGVNDAVLFVDLAVEAVDNAILLVNLSVQGIDGVVLFSDLTVKGVNDTILFIDLGVQVVDNAILFVDGFVLCGSLVGSCIEGGFVVGDLCVSRVQQVFLVFCLGVFAFQKLLEFGVFFTQGAYCSEDAFNLLRQQVHVFEIHYFSIFGGVRNLLCKIYKIFL